jgi:hypothetical protein
MDLKAIHRMIVCYAILIVTLLASATIANARGRGNPLQSPGQAPGDWLSQAKRAEGAGDLSRAADSYLNYLTRHSRNQTS